MWQGLFHDMSKYSPTEFIPGVKNYADGKRSPNEKERVDKGYSAAWLHHKGRNKHHFEYWNDYNMKTHIQEPVKMPIKYVAEMFCDRVAASKIYQGENYKQTHPYEYFIRSKSTRPIHPETSDQIEGLLKTLADEGEEAAFKRVRELLKFGK